MSTSAARHVQFAAFAVSKSSLAAAAAASSSSSSTVSPAGKGTDLLIVDRESSASAAAGADAAGATAAPSSAGASSSARILTQASLPLEAHKGHYLCEECTEETLSVLLTKALEKRSRRIRSKLHPQPESPTLTTAC